MAETKQAEIQPETVDEAKIAEINASVLAAPEAPAVDLLGDPVAEAAAAEPVVGLADMEARLYLLEGQVAAFEARIEQLLAEKAKPAPAHPRTLDELPSPFAPT